MIKENSWQIPSIEEIYNEIHRQRFFYRNGIYPRKIKNFDALNDISKKEPIIRFQNMIKRNQNSINWKLYIKSIAEITNGNFDLSYIGTLKGNKIYRGYIQYLYKKELSPNEIISEIKNSISFIITYIKNNNIKFKEYFNENRFILPITLEHIYAGYVSIYFYAALPPELSYKLLSYNDEQYEELFQCSKNDFFEQNINPIRNYIIKFSQIQNFLIKLEKNLKNI